MVTEGIKRGRGRPRALTGLDITRLRHLVKGNPSLTLREITVLMEPHVGKRLALTTWSHALVEIGFKKVRPAKTPTSAEEEKHSKATRYKEIHRREPEPGRYPSSLTDHEWEALCIFLEEKGGRGRPALHSRRSMWDAVFYLVRSGAPWRMLPADLPHYKAVFAFFARARDSGLLEEVYDRLHALWRERGKREASPSAGVVDSQSVKTTEKGGSAGMTRAKR